MSAETRHVSAQTTCASSRSRRMSAWRSADRPAHMGIRMMRPTHTSPLKAAYAVEHVGGRSSVHGVVHTPKRQGHVRKDTIFGMWLSKTRIGAIGKEDAGLAFAGKPSRRFCHD